MVDAILWERLGTAAVLFVILLLVINHFMKTNDKIMDLANLQNENWQRISEKMSEAISQHTENAKEFHATVMADHCSMKEANNFQREEHKEQISMLQESAESLRAMNVKNVSFEERMIEANRLLMECYKRISETLSEQIKIMSKINNGR